MEAEEALIYRQVGPAVGALRISDISALAWSMSKVSRSNPWHGLREPSQILQSRFGQCHWHTGHAREAGVIPGPSRGAQAETTPNPVFESTYTIYAATSRGALVRRSRPNAGVCRIAHAAQLRLLAQRTFVYARSHKPLLRKRSSAPRPCSSYVGALRKR